MKKKSYAHTIIIAIMLTLACSLTNQVPLQSPESDPLPETDPTILSISAGGTHACALLKNGDVMCWGDNSSGQLGSGTYSPSPIPVKVVEVTDAVAISANGAHTCAITKSEEMKCWGDNHYGQLGDGTKTMSNVPVKVIDLPTTIASISLGFDHTCAITTDGKALCWGQNLHGRLGDGSNSYGSTTPVEVINLADKAVGITASDEHTCVLLNSGGIQCWGSNTSGQLGISGSKNVSKTPTNVIDLDSGVVSVSLGFSKSCAILSSGIVKCWGWIGLDHFSDFPTEMNGLNQATSVAAGGGHVCAAILDGGVKCVGENSSGQLGNGKTTESFKPVQVEGLEENVLSVVANFDFTCALLNNGEVKCWGDNSTGQLGNGTTESSSVPVDVIGLIIDN
jgi:alpha-tubulin suppressor-like RCC1 family protein